MARVYTIAQLKKVVRSRALVNLGLMERVNLRALASQLEISEIGDRAALIQRIIAKTHPVKPCGCGQKQAEVKQESF